MVLLGALVEKTGIVDQDVLLQSIFNHGKKEFYEVNQKALGQGAALVSTQTV